MNPPGASSVRKATNAMVLDESRASWLIQLIVPVYNEGENITTLYRSLLQEQIPFDSLKFIYDFEEDTTLPFIEQISKTDSRVRAEKNEYGRGVLNALRWAFAKAEDGPVIVLMGDNSDKLSVIPDLVSAWYNGATIVAPSRYMPGGRQYGGPVIKTALSTVAGKFLGFCGFPTSDPTNNFKLYDGRWLASQKIESSGGFEVALELSYKCYAEGRPIIEVPTEWWDRTAGESKFKVWSWIPRYLHWYARALTEIARRKIRGD